MITSMCTRIIKCIQFFPDRLMLHFSFCDLFFSFSFSFSQRILDVIHTDNKYFFLIQSEYYDKLSWVILERKPIRFKKRKEKRKVNRMHNDHLFFTRVIFCMHICAPVYIRVCVSNVRLFKETGSLNFDNLKRNVTKFSSTLIFSHFLFSFFFVFFRRAEDPKVSR